MVDSAPVAAPVATSTETSSESIENLDNDLVGDDSPVTPEAKPAPKTVAEVKRLNKLKIKFNQKEEDVDLPFDIPDDPKAVEWMQKNMQMARLGTTKAQEYSQLEKEVFNFVEELRKNPRKALANPNIGVDIKKLAAEVLEEEIANSQKSPELLERERLEHELKSMKEDREREKEQFRQKELERYQEQEFQRYDSLMDKAFTEAKVPKNAWMVKRMADYMIYGIESGKQLTPQDVLPVVQEEMMEDLREMFASMPADRLKDVIGKDNLDKIRKYNISVGKKAPPAPVSSQVKDIGNVKKPTSSEPVKKQTLKDYFGI